MRRHTREPDDKTEASQAHLSGPTTNLECTKVPFEVDKLNIVYFARQLLVRDVLRDDDSNRYSIEVQRFRTVSTVYHYGNLKLTKNSPYHN